MKYVKIISYKTLVLLVFLFGHVGSSIGQSKDECGAVPNQEYLNYLESTLTERETIVSKYYKNRQLGRVTNLNIPIQFHVSRTTEGDDPAVNETDLLQVIDNINTTFSSMGMSFMSCGQTKFIDDTFLHTNFEKDLHDPLLDQYDDKFILNIYFFADLIGVNGYAKFPQDQIDRIVVSRERALTSTMEHELGHYFSLLHTYSTSRGEELVSGANCRVAGDLICDTPPDPGERSDFNACIYVGTAVDAAGDVYTPDGFNYMGRGEATCRNKFSLLQRERILASLLMDRYYLVDCSQTEPVSTDCIATITSFPYEESFEDFAGGTEWRQNIDDDFGWEVGSSTTSSSTGPENALEGDYFMFTEASDFTNATGILSSPCFDLQNKGTASISFGYHMFGVDIGKLELQISEDMGTTWITLWVQQGNKGDQWNTVVVAFDNYVGNIVQLRFVGQTGSDSKGDMAIDDVEVISEVVTGIEKPIETILKVYPNPTQKTLAIDFQNLTDRGLHTLYVTNVEGRIIYNELINNAGNSREYQLDVSQWAYGTYFVSLIGKSKKVTTTFIRKP